ncbi:MAG: hypothetical protein V4544_04625 [Pseudomonadota bacterium]
MDKKVIPYFLVLSEFLSISYEQEINEPVVPIARISTMYKVIHDTAVPTLTRPLMSTPFDMVTI